MADTVQDTQEELSLGSLIYSGRNKDLDVEQIREELRGKTFVWTPYMHADWAWCHTRLWHDIRYVSVFEDVVALMEKDVGFRWYMDCYRTEFECVVNRRPDLIPAIRKYVEQGEIEICGAYANVRPNMVADEAYVRNMVIGRQCFAAFFPNTEIVVHADSVDVVLGHQQLPQLMTKGGYRYFRAGRPYSALAEADGLAHELIWQGLDGTRIPMWWGEYGGLFYEEAVLKVKLEPEHWEETVRHLWREELAKASDYSNLDCLLVANGCDDILPLKAFNRRIDLDLPGLIRTWNERETSTMRMGTPVDFFREMEKRAGQIKVHTGAIDICDACYNVAWGAERGLVALRMAGAEKLAEAERWMALAALLGAFEPMDTTPIWKDNLTASAHATAWLFHKDFGEIHALATDALRDAERLAQRATEAITRRIQMPEKALAVAFNPDDTACEAVLECTIPTGALDTLELRDGNGEVVEWQATKPYEYTDCVWEYKGLVRLKLPAMGYNTITAAGGTVDCRYGEPYVSTPKPERTKTAIPFELDNGLLRLSFEYGRLVSVWDAESGEAVFVGQATPWNTLRFNKVDTDAWDLHTGPVEYRQDVHFSACERLEDGPLRWRVKLYGQDTRCAYTQTITLEKGSRVIGFQVELDWPDRQQGYLSCVMPTVGNDRLYGGIPFGIEQKDVANTRYGRPGSDTGSFWLNGMRSVEGLFCAKDFVAAQGDRHTGVLFHVRGDRFYTYDKHTKELSYVLLYAATLSEDTWEQEVNRYSVCQVGAHTLSWAIGVYPPSTPLHDIARQGRRLRLPAFLRLPYRGVDCPAELPKARSLLECDNPAVVVSALYPRGDGIVLRVWESAGAPAQATLRLPAQVRSARLEDFNGNAWDGPAPVVKDGALWLSLAPWEIATLGLTLE